MWKGRKFILCVLFFYNLPPTSADHSFSGLPASLYTAASGPMKTQVRSRHCSALHLQGALHLTQSKSQHHLSRFPSHLIFPFFSSLNSASATLKQQASGPFHLLFTEPRNPLYLLPYSFQFYLIWFFGSNA